LGRVIVSLLSFPYICVITVACCWGFCCWLKWWRWSCPKTPSGEGKAPPADGDGGP
jgi:hypothetical protein